MALENVVNEVISQAEKQKQEIIDQGKQEAKKIVDEATNKAKERTKHLEEETKKIMEETKRMEISSANIRAQKMLLEAKKNILEELNKQVMEKISKLDSARRKELMQTLADRAKEELRDAKYIYCSEKDKELVSGVKSLKFNGAIDCMGGIVVENEDRTIRVNYTFDIILQNVKEAYLNEIAKRIFQKEN